MTFEELQDSIKRMELSRLEFQRIDKNPENCQYFIDLDNEFAQSFSENCRDYLIEEIRRSFIDMDSDQSAVIAYKIYSFCYNKYHSMGYFAVLEECYFLLKLVIDILILFT